MGATSKVPPLPATTAGLSAGSLTAFIPAKSIDAQTLRPPAGHAASRAADAGETKPWLWLLYGVIVGGICAYTYANVENLDTLWQDAENDKLMRIVFYPAMFWTAAVIFLLSFRTLRWIRYRPQPACMNDEAPTLSVVIPAYNEGAMVLKTIESVLSAPYPDGKLELFVVDDGSKDDTWQYISEAAARYPQRVTAVRFPENRGKRAALTCGFERAQGEVIVTLDSDCVIEPGALLALVGPFRNPKVGAVAGKVAVYNQEQGLIPRMLHIRFLITFDVLRAMESSYGTVYCCPGALSAFRTKAVREVLPRWANQHFLGSRCTIGEDRAMTNFLLDAGWDTSYQGSAVVYTVAPASYRTLSKMFLRWDRSYIREELRLMKIAWKRPPFARWITLFDRVVTNLKFPISYLALVVLAVTFLTIPVVGLRFLVAGGLVSLLATVYVMRSEGTLRGLLLGVMFAYYTTFTMFWIMPYAFFTLRDRSWLTR